MARPTLSALAAAALVVTAAVAPSGAATATRTTTRASQRQVCLNRSVDELVGLLPKTECLPPREDLSTTEQEAYGPWTEPVRCVVTKQSSAQCAYITSSLAEGKGTALITAPEIAASLVSSPTFDLSARLYASISSSPKYKTEPIEGKGLGVVATAPIAKGEVFMVDYPALLASMEYVSEAAREVKLRLILETLERLPDETRDKVWSLWPGEDDLEEEVGGVGRLAGILETNTCRVALNDKESHLGLFPEISRFNHGCEPSAYYRFSQGSLAAEVVAYEDLSPGDEITINYAFLGMPSIQRHKLLLQNWKFNCTCPKCTERSTALGLSDHNRHLIWTTKQQVTDAISSRNYDAGIPLAEKAMELCHEEHLPALMPEYEELMAKLYRGLKVWTEAEGWARRAAKGYEMFWGADNHKATEMWRFVREMGRKR